eukprot:scaffold15131_cov88-Isochrysis_galbana.AAC.1
MLRHRPLSLSPPKPSGGQLAVLSVGGGDVAAAAQPDTWQLQIKAGGHEQCRRIGRRGGAGKIFRLLLLERLAPRRL